jgi:hypothetical protein
VEETSAAPVEDGAPAATDEAASAVTETTGAPAPTQPEGYIEQKRYDDLRAEFDRKNTLLDRALRGDAQAAQELGFEFADDQQDPDPGNEEQDYGEAETADPVAREWIEQQKAEKNLALFNSHLDRLAGGPDVLDDWDRQALLSASAAGGFNEQSTEAAFKQWKERNDAREKAQFEKWKQSKQAPHVSPGGTGATETPYRDDMSVRELTKAAEQQFRLAREQ